MNVVYGGDVILTLVLLLLVVAVFAFELAGETVQGWHTISWWAHRERWLRWLILGLGLALLVWLVFHHFAMVIPR